MGKLRTKKDIEMYYRDKGIESPSLTTLVFSPKPRNGRALGELVEAISNHVPIKVGKKVDEIEVESHHASTVQRILGINGYEVVDKRLHEIQKSKLLGALEILDEKYDLDDRPKAVKPPPGVHRRNVLNFVNRKARAARKKRSNTRVQSRRDRLDGKISALEDMLRYIKRK